jgi:hypothetical protein
MARRKSRFQKTKSPVSSRKTGPWQPRQQANYKAFAPSIASPRRFQQEGICHRVAAVRANRPNGRRGSGFIAVNEWQNANLKRHSLVKKKQ